MISLLTDLVSLPFGQDQTGAISKSARNTDTQRQQLQELD